MRKIKIGIAGLGVVGRGVYEILQEESQNLAKKCECEFEITAVSALERLSFVDPAIKFYTNAIDMASDPEVEVVVELIGGVKIAKDLVFTALKNGKNVVTANKAMIALNNKEIADLCDNSSGRFAFEAAVIAANPVIKAYKESFVANKITKFFGILNGTCNFILSKMTSEKLSYQQVLAEAQKLGFAEANPALDVEGFDAAHKAAILSSIALGYPVEFQDIYVEGIENISLVDIELAKQMGYEIKLLGVFEKNEKLNQALISVYPALVHNSEQISKIAGSYNCLLTLGSNFEWNMMIGRGAGSRPTASAVVADIVDIAMDRGSKEVFSISPKNYHQISCQKISSRLGKYCLRLDFLPEVTINKNLLAELLPKNISISSAAFLRGEKNSDQNHINQNSCAILTENCLESDISEFLLNLDKSMLKAAKFIRVEETKF